jgi:methylenetetrahydrofolate dehydrogenase (NADP+)/methenyltetrahydrofolate cyclohydrolase
MTASILDGKLVAEQLQQTLKEQVSERVNKGLRPPALAVILVGNHQASHIYVKNKRMACQLIGFTSHAYDLPENTQEQALLTLIQKLNEDSNIDGILVQLPLPSHIDTNKIIEAIHPSKDVDGFHPYNLGRLAQRRPFIRPCTPYGIICLLSWYQLNLQGLHAVVIGASNIVGRPMSLELLIADSTVTICHRRTNNLEKHVADADLLVVAAGKMDIVQPEWIKKGAIVVDVGIHRLDDGTLRGDLNFHAAAERASWITPVPKGVGPMTITTLLQNTLLCMEQNNDKP